MLQDILTSEVIQTLAGILASLIVGGLGHVTNTLRRKFETERQQAIIDRVESAAIAAVLTTQQTFVESLKAQGQFAPQDQAVALLQAVEATKVELGRAGMAELRKLSENADALIRQRVEAALRALKQDGAL